MTLIDLMRNCMVFLEKGSPTDERHKIAISGLRVSLALMEDGASPMENIYTLAKGRFDNEKEAILKAVTL
jgi:hypothetical protein